MLYQIRNEIKHNVLFQVPPTKEASTQPPRVSPTLPSSNPTVHVVSMIPPQRRNESESKECFLLPSRIKPLSV